MSRKSIKFVIHRFAIVLMVSLSFQGCGTLMHINVIPISKDIELGRQMDEEIRRHPNEYPILVQCQDIKSYVENIGNKILASPDIVCRNQFAYKFDIIEDDSTVNAFCTLGGYVYVYTGLLKILDDEATLTGVLAHEIAHAEKRHSTNKISAQYGLQPVMELANNRIGTSGVQAANVVVGFGLLKYNRDEEKEADTYSFKYLQSTEYFPGATRFFFEKTNSQGSSEAMERLLSTHPLPQDRYDHVNRLLCDAGNPQYTESHLFRE
jgi:beta-barrel assembly-enhancing protease